MTQLRLGVTDGRLAPCGVTPNCVSSQADDPRRRMVPLPLHGTPAESIGRLRQIIERLPRTRIVTATDNYLHAEFVTLICRYVDDVEFYADAADGVIHFRSASRVGYSDFGVNRRRMQRLSALYGRANAT